MTLQDGIRFFTRETEILSGVSVACGAGERIETAMDGDVGGRSVFDLASVTKLFTGSVSLTVPQPAIAIAMLIIAVIIICFFMIFLSLFFVFGSCFCFSSLLTMSL